MEAVDICEPFDELIGVVVVEVSREVCDPGLPPLEEVEAQLPLCRGRGGVEGAGTGRR
jgi:hypothetical protein